MTSSVQPAHGTLTGAELTEILDQLDDIALRGLAAMFCSVDQAEFIAGVRSLRREALPERLRSAPDEAAEYVLTPLDHYVGAVVDALIRHGLGVREHWTEADPPEMSAGINLALTLPKRDGQDVRSVLQWNPESGWYAGQIVDDHAAEGWRYFAVGRVPHPADVVEGVGRWIAQPRGLPDSSPDYVPDARGMTLDQLLAVYDPAAADKREGR